MADFNFEIGKDFLDSIGAMGRTDEIAPKLLTAAAPFLKAEFEKKLKEHSETGELAASLKITKVKKAKNGSFYIAVRPTGESKTYIDKNGTKRQRKKPIRNIEKLIYQEYGTPTQAARPVLTTVLKNAEAKCLEIMTRTFEEVNR